jgi:hypothetical protein
MSIEMDMPTVIGAACKTYLKAKIEDLEANNKINNIRDLYKGINENEMGGACGAYGGGKRCTQSVGEET